MPPVTWIKVKIFQRLKLSKVNAFSLKLLFLTINWLIYELTMPIYACRLPQLYRLDQPCRLGKKCRLGQPYRLGHQFGLGQLWSRVQ